MREKRVRVDKRKKRGDQRFDQLATWIKKRNIIAGGRVLGKVCRNHPELRGERWASNRGCIACQRERANILRSRNLEKQRARDCAKAKAWRKRNPGKVCELTIRKRVQQERATPKWANLDHIKGMYEVRDLFRRAGLVMEIDHVIPLRGRNVCGLHVENNLQLLHESENLSKCNQFQAK